MSTTADDNLNAPVSGYTELAPVTVYDQFLPPQALPLLLLLIVIFPLALLAAESLMIPLFDWLQAFVTGRHVFLPYYFFIKLACFGVLAFLGFLQLLLRIDTIYYTVWARFFPRPHSLHVDYHPDSQQSILALLNWHLFRFGMVVIPPVGLALIMMVVFSIELYCFNLFAQMPFLSVPIQMALALFVMLVLGMLFVFLCGASVWNLFSTLFGNVVAVTEPSLPAKTVFDRCKRIMFSSPLVYLMIPAYGLFLAGALTEVYFLLQQYDIQDFTGFRMNFLLVFGFEVLTLMTYLMLNYLKFYTYHQALGRYYASLPRQFKERFSPPPALS